MQTKTPKLNHSMVTKQGPSTVNFIPQFSFFIKLFYLKKAHLGITKTYMPELSPLVVVGRWCYILFDHQGLQQNSCKPSFIQNNFDRNVRYTKKSSVLN